MTKTFENMLYLFGANANRAELCTIEDIDSDAIRQYAVEQGIWTMVYPELAKICDVKRYQAEFLMAVSAGVTRKEFTLNIIKKLEENGIKCCLLKGAAVCGLYADPECRISSDTDILIDPKDEKKLSKLLREYGYEVENRGVNDHHLKARHSVGGLFEAHIMLYSHTTSGILFNGLEMYGEPWDTSNINGYDYNVLGVNDGLMYLTAHYIKHLINSGGGVRQMMDLLLYIEAHKDKIDFDKYNNLLKELKYDKLIDVVKSVGGKYFGFDYEVKNIELMDKILSDTETGGIFGFSTDTRKNFYKTYCEKRTTMSKKQYKIFWLLKNEHSIWDRLFPNQKMLITKHGYAYAKNKLLIPVAWINRYIDILTGRRKKIYKHLPSSDNTEFKERMQLMRDLGMID